VPPPEARPPRRRLYAAPRRFDLATLLVITTAYALLMGGLGALGAPPLFTAIVAGYVTLVGIGQAALFGGRKPRRPSMLVGMTLYAIWILTTMWNIWHVVSFGSALPFILFVSTVGLVQGAILAYLAGVLVAGVFLVADLLRGRL
jgi:hypothetical protein